MSARPEDWMTIDDVATEMKVPKETVYHWNRRGTGPKRHKIGIHVRYKRVDFEAWLKKRVVA